MEYLSIGSYLLILGGAVLGLVIGLWFRFSFRKRRPEQAKSIELFVAGLMTGHVLMLLWMYFTEFCY